MNEREKSDLDEELKEAAVEFVCLIKGLHKVLKGEVEVRLLTIQLVRHFFKQRLHLANKLAVIPFLHPFAHHEMKGRKKSRRKKKKKKKKRKEKEKRKREKKKRKEKEKRKREKKKKKRKEKEEEKKRKQKKKKK